MNAGNLDSAATLDVLAWATVLDNRRSSAQVIPALAGAAVGAFPGGFALLHAIVAVTGGDSDRARCPRSGRRSPWWRIPRWWSRRSPPSPPGWAAAVP